MKAKSRMNRAFRAKFEKAKGNLGFIDELMRLLAFNDKLLIRALERMTPLSKYYEKDQDDIKQLIKAVWPGSMDAKGLDGGEEVYDEFANHYIHRLIEYENTWETDESYANIQTYVDNVYIEAAMAMKCRLYNYVAVFNYNVPIHKLYKKAKSGDLEAFYKLIRIDKTAMLDEWAQRLIREKQYRGDWEFFEEMAREIGKKPLREPSTFLKPLILANYFWEEYFEQWSYKEVLEFFKDQELIRKDMDEFTFQKLLNRFGIKKYERGKRKTKSNKVVS